MKKNVQNLSSGKTGHKPVIRDIYDCLLDLHGHQGWWPLTELHETGGINPQKPVLSRDITLQTTPTRKPEVSSLRLYAGLCLHRIQAGFRLKNLFSTLSS